MNNIPKEKPLTRVQIQKRVNPLRSIMALMTRFRKTIGKEMLLNTEAGKVRVLTYNLDNPKKLPLFVNIHGGGFVIGNAELDDPYLMKAAENANVKILNIDYSISSDVMFPVALNECYAVVKYAKEHSDELGIDETRMANDDRPFEKVPLERSLLVRQKYRFCSLQKRYF